MTTGVIVGRFQTPFLHEAHIKLINTVIKKSDRVIIILGISKVRGGGTNPLDYETRRKMIHETFPDVIISYAEDQKSDKVWSNNIDSTIDALKTNGEVTLFGSRDSFIPFYCGKYPTKELDSDIIISATELRNQAAKKVYCSADFRAGAIYSAADRRPTVYTTVDVVIFNDDNSKILLGRKSGEDKFRFIGGFSEPSSTSFEMDARREVYEEANININNLKYLGSYNIDDWRYKKEASKIRTLLFSCNYESGQVKAGDDICEVRWFNLSDLSPIDVVEEHIILLKAIKGEK
jgi:bifunctional NMN adenylyltransferase/nudix hydrolase